MTTPVQGLPPGLTLSPQGVLSGTPTQAGTYQFPVTVTDANGNSATATLTMTVLPALTIAITVVPPAEAGQPYTFTLTPSGGAPPYTWQEP